MGIESLKLIVAISCFNWLYFICNLLVGYSKVELCFSILHLDDNRSTSLDACLYLFEFYGFCTLISRKEFEGTEVLTIERYLERQAERCPDSTFYSAAVRCSLGCEWLVSHEVLAIVKNEIIRSKSFSRCSYLLIAILAYQLGEIASLVVGVGLVDFVWVTHIMYKTFEVCAAREHARTISNLSRNKIVAGVDGCESVAVKEHIGHMLHLRSVEASKVERIEILTIIEHTSHIRHIRCIQIFKTCNSLQAIEFSKETIQRCWSVCNETLIENDTLDI